VAPRLDQKRVKRPLGRRRRVRRVEDVAGDDQGIRPLGLEQVREPGEEAFVLEGPVVAVQGVAEVPVGGVDEAKHRVATILARSGARRGATVVKGKE